MLGMACGGPAASTPAPPTETSAATVTPPLQSPGDGPNEERGLEEQPQADATSGAVKAATMPPGSPAPTTPVIPADKPAAGSELSPETATAAVQSPPAQSSPAIEGPVVRVGKAVFPVELALTAEQRSQGLSGRETLPSGTGMLFVYQQERQYSFWMKEMRFPLDMVWIGADCTVVDLTLGAPIPEPDQTLEQLPRFSPVRPTQYVLEINAGESVAGDIEPGDLVEFAGDLVGRYGC